MRINRNSRRYNINASRSRTAEILDDYKLAIAKDVAKAANQIVIQYQNDITRACRNDEIQLPIDHDINLIKYDRAIDFAEEDLINAIFTYVVEAATYAQNG